MILAKCRLYITILAFYYISNSVFAVNNFRDMYKDVAREYLSKADHDLKFKVILPEPNTDNAAFNKLRETYDDLADEYKQFIIDAITKNRYSTNFRWLYAYEVYNMSVPLE
ncbi:uncharacterized protein LOC132923018 isoform X1 [Rhopalosiphum padi]|uniref:uncharacterized protein LOC132923018 isoform X1 n=1 Tax=Rhopalosiphum padi TaxID=40932 RepID=UPI00298E873F|nr:uncharacterized protein LOC132923018 isoform X1 [Rhopalosiphum padi]